MGTVEEYKDSLEEEEVKKACRSILKRAKACVEAGGGAFEYKMRKAKQAAEE